MRAKQALRKLADTALEPFGFRFERTSTHPKLGDFVRALNRQGVSITTAFDIGAHVGSWSQSMAKVLPASTAFYLFEPNAVHRGALDATGHTVIPYLLSDRAADVPFYSVGGTGDSVFLENTTHYDGVDPTLLRSHTLDEAVAELSLPKPDLVKIDTQGSEIAIMRGGSKTLAATKLIYLEMPVLRYNHGAPRFDEYIDHLRSNGFVPVGLFESHVIQHTLFQVDILFMSHASFSEAFGTDDLSYALRLSN